MFEVGQKVRYGRTGDGVVTYGPYKSTFGEDAYLVKREDGIERTWFGRHMSAIPEPPRFTVGDVVNLTTRPGAKATVEYGPFDGRDVYVVKLIDEPADDNPRTFTAMASVMKPLEPVKVGDRVRVVRDSDGYRSGYFVGLVGALKHIDEADALPYLVEFGDGSGMHGDPESGRWYCAEVERVEDENTYTYDGVAYDLTAKYRDKDGDVWEFGARRENGEPRVHCSASGYDDLETVLDAYGPLTRI
jgi:hypothetical protein